MLSKRHTAETVLFILTVVTVMVAAVVCCFNKQGMHEDEFYSYYSSNRTYGPVLEGTVSRDTVMDELTVLDGEGFNFGLVREVQSWDVHPPVYYFILHFVCSLMPGVFSMWQGLCINLGCMLISLILMMRLGDKLIPRDVTVCLGTLAWGISAATLTGVVFIRMYMLLTVWILAVTLLHLRKTINIRFWLLLGCITFLGFMTHYYFFIWLFFLAVAWNIREIFRTKSIRTTLYYGLTMIISFGLCYLFYPAFPAQMFRGQRGAQAAGNFLDIGNTWERLGFFAEKINRIGFGGILWILTGLAVIMYLLNADSRRGLRPKAARWSANGSGDTPGEGAKTGHGRRCGSDVMILICALAGYFLVVSKTALMLGDSSIRYQMPVLGILCLCLAAGLKSGACGVAGVLTRDGEKSARYGMIAAGTMLAVLIVMNIVSDVNGGISFLYPEKKAHMETLAAYPDAEVIYVYPDGQSWTAWADMTELLKFEEVTYIPSGSFTSEYDADPHVLADEYDTDTMILFADKGTAVPQSGDMECLYSDVYCDIYVIFPGLKGEKSIFGSRTENH